MSDPRRRRQRRTLAALGVLLALLALLVLWVSLRPDLGEPVALRPSETRRGSTVLRSSARPAPTPDAVPPTAPGEPEEPDPIVTVHARLAGLEWLDRNSYRNASGPAGFLPAIDEAPFPASETLEWLDAEPDRWADDPTELLALAESEGLVVGTVDPVVAPWQALLALELETLRVDQLVGELDVPRSRTLLLDAALELEGADPDHPAADFARLYVIEALGDGVGDVADLQGATEMALAVFEQTEDPLVAHLALVEAIRPSNPELEARDHALLVKGAEAFPALREDVAVFAMHTAFDAGDRATAATWWGRLDGWVAEGCDCADPAPPRAGRRGLDCKFLCPLVVRPGAQLVAAGALHPQTWQAALRGAVVVCHAAHPDVRPFQVVGGWDGGWRWHQPPQPEFLACVADTALEPCPEPGQRVRLIVGS